MPGSNVSEPYSKCQKRISLGMYSRNMCTFLSENNQDVCDMNFYLHVPGVRSTGHTAEGAIARSGYFVVGCGSGNS